MSQSDNECTDSPSDSDSESRGDSIVGGRRWVAAAPFYAIATVCALLLSSVPVLAQTPDPQSISLKALSYGVFIAGAAADLQTTQAVLKAGGAEANPLLGNSIGQIALRKSLISAGVLVAAHMVERNGHRRVASVLRFAGGGVQFGAAVHNARLKR